MNDRIFVSYARSESQLVLPVADRLKLDGWRVWLDQSSIPASVPWMDEIDQAIRSAVLVMVCESFAWHGSANCLLELDLARRLGKPVLFVDPSKETPDQIAGRASEALRQVGPSLRLGAELAARAFRWTRGGEHGSDLATGRRLRAYRQLLSDQTDQGISDKASQRFVQASRRRRRRRVGLTSGVVFVALLLILVQTALSKANDLLASDLAQATTQLNDDAAVTQAIQVSPYEGLRQALVVARKQRDSFASRTVLTLASSSLFPLSYTPASSVVPSSPRTRRASSRATGLTATITGTTVRITDGTGRLVRLVSGVGAVRAIAWRPDGRRLALADASGVRVIDPRGGAGETALAGAPTVMSLAWRGYSHIVGWTSDGHRAVWAIPAGAPLAHRDDWWFMASSRSPDGTVGALSRNGAVVAVVNGRVRLVGSAGPGEGTAFAWAPGGWLITMSGPTPRIVQMSPSGAVVSHSTGSCMPLAVAWDASLRRAVIGCGDGRYGLWDPTGQTLTVRATNLLQIGALVPLGSEMVMSGGIEEYATLSSSGHLRLLRYGYPGCLRGVRLLAVSGTSIFNAGSGLSSGCSQRLTVASGGVSTDIVYPPGATANESRGLAVSPDSRLIAYGASDGTISILRTGDLALVDRIQATCSEIRGLEFSGNGRKLFAFTRDGDVLALSTAMAYESIGQAMAHARHMLEEGRRDHLMRF